jgi:hypothetical protein
VIELLEAAAATHRIARLAVTDSIFESWRDWWVRGCYRWAYLKPPEPSPYKPLAEVAMDDPNHPKLVELASCQFCVGVWAAALVLVLQRVPVGRTLVRWLAVAGVQSALTEALHR